MDERHAICRLVGALRLTDAKDGIGIPLFNGRGSNELYVGETDFELRITKFVPYPEAEEFRIDYGILDLRTKHFSIGDYSPIPFWLDDRANALPGNLTVEEFDQIFGSRLGAVAQELRTIVHRSRTGYFQARMAEGEREFVLNEYPDVWDEEPVNSLYWVSRFRSAKRVASRLQGPAAEEMRERLRERAQEWIRRFQYKGHFRLLIELIRTAGDGLIEERELQLSLFESIVDRLERNDINALKRPDVKNAVHRYFPQGLFRFHVWEHQSIQQNFNSRRNPEVRRSVFRPRTHVDFYGMLENYLHDDVWHGLDTLLALTSTIFGDSDLPPQILQRLHSLYTEKVEIVKYELQKAFHDDFRVLKGADMWEEKARRLLAEINRINFMLRILEAPSRLTGIVPQKVKPFDDGIIEELRRYVD